MVWGWQGSAPHCVIQDYFVHSFKEHFKGVQIVDSNGLSDTKVGCGLKADKRLRKKHGPFNLVATQKAAQQDEKKNENRNMTRSTRSAGPQHKHQKWERFRAWVADHFLQFNLASYDGINMKWGELTIQRSQWLVTIYSCTNSLTFLAAAICHIIKYTVVKSLTFKRNPFLHIHTCRSMYAQESLRGRNYEKRSFFTAWERSMPNKTLTKTIMRTCKTSPIQ